MCSRNVVGVLVGLLVAGSGAAAAEPGYTLAQLTRMSRCALEALYRDAEPGSVPCGRTRGKPIHCPDEPLARLRSKAVGTVWRGKLFGPDEMLINQWLAFRAIRARVYVGPSWCDGRPSIILDYHDTSRVWADVRDEIREVSPGVYLGRMYRRDCAQPQFKMFFALEVVPGPPCH